jgi:hypothetical protein
MPNGNLLVATYAHVSGALASNRTFPDPPIQVQHGHILV